MAFSKVLGYSLKVKGMLPPPCFSCFQQVGVRAAWRSAEPPYASGAARLPLRGHRVFAQQRMPLLRLGGLAPMCIPPRI